MNGGPFFFILSAFIFIHAVAQATPVDQCAWTESKVKASAEKLPAFAKAQFERLQSVNKSVCVLPESFDQDRSARKGAIQALEITRKNCMVPDQTDTKNSAFLFQAFSLQGLKFTAGADQKKLKAKDFEPSQIFKNKDNFHCFGEVSNENALKPGDLLVTKGDAVIVDSIGPDPYGIDELIKNLKINKDQGTIAEQAKNQCDDLLKDPAQFRISVFHSGGRSPIFPRYGKKSSLWVTALTERANSECIRRVSEALSASSGTPFVEPIETKTTEMGLLTLRHHSDQAACRVPHDQMPNLPDLECVQRCDDREGR